MLSNFVKERDRDGEREVSINVFRSGTSRETLASVF